VSEQPSDRTKVSLKGTARGVGTARRAAPTAPPEPDAAETAGASIAEPVRRVRLPGGGVVRFRGNDEKLRRNYPGAEVVG
jgi:hypothetical protein